MLGRQLNHARQCEAEQQTDRVQQAQPVVWAWTSLSSSQFPQSFWQYSLQCKAIIHRFQGRADSHLLEVYTE